MNEQILIGGELRGTRILRQEVALFEIELAQLRDPCRLRQDVGPIAKQTAHLGFRFDVALLAEEAEPLGVIEILPRADGKQDVVRFGVFLL